MTFDEIDPHAALAALRFDADGPLVRVTGGWDTAIWRFPTVDGAQHVLRVYRSEENAPSARNEQLALNAATAAGLPVPRIEAAGTSEGRPKIVLSWCDGVTLADYMQRRPWSFWRLGVEFWRVQAAIHRVTAPPELRQIPIAAWLDRTGLPSPVLDPVYAAGLARDHLVHLDYHPINILTDGTRITGVLDWSTAAAGDRRVDLARTSSLLEAGPIPPSRLKPIASLGRRLFCRAWRKGYERVAGPCGNLAIFQVWAGETFVRDLESRIGESQVWATPSDLASARRWTERWWAQTRKVSHRSDDPS